MIHSGFAAPDKGVSLLDFMPNHPMRAEDVAPTPTSLSNQQQTAKDDYMARVMQLTAELKQKAESGVVGPLLAEMTHASE